VYAIRDIRIVCFTDRVTFSFRYRSPANSDRLVIDIPCRGISFFIIRCCFLTIADRIPERIKRIVPPLSYAHFPAVRIILSCFFVNFMTTFPGGYAHNSICTVHCSSGYTVGTEFVDSIEPANKVVICVIRHITTSSDRGQIRCGAASFCLAKTGNTAFVIICCPLAANFIPGIPDHPAIYPCFLFSTQIVTIHAAVIIIGDIAHFH